MGPIVDRTKENLVSTDNGIIMARHRLLRALQGDGEGRRRRPASIAEHQHVRSAAVVLPPDKHFKDAAKEALVRADRQGTRDGLSHAIRIRPHVERRRGALPHRRAELQAARGQGDRARPAERARGQGPGAAPMEQRDASSPRRRSAARRKQGESFAGWLSDLAGRTKNLIEEVDSADLVVMVATAGESAQAASVIGEACSVKRVMTTALDPRRPVDFRRGAVEDAVAPAALGADAGDRQRRGLHCGHADRIARLIFWRGDFT